MRPDESPHDEGPHRVEILLSERVLDGFFRVDRVQLRHERFDGRMSPPMTRLLFERGDSVAVLPYDRKRDEVLLVRQFRYPAFVRGGPGWLWEIIAGMQEEGVDPKDVARNEAMEEAGYRLGPLRHIATVYPSPGGSSERVAIYLASVTEADRVSAGGGLEESGEDIQVRMVPLDEALAMIEDGRIMDAKTVLALQYLALHRREFVE
ncbi:MAG TPA: NUDIX domain-containing protein [Chloroflexi bacterium]|jgi:ADP-ribose pyrophosphatase|nr:NUDIX domain-containing protein [Chloroflexota bacterium]